jgi:hypothetical protein
MNLIIHIYFEIILQNMEKRVDNIIKQLYLIFLPQKIQLKLLIQKDNSVEIIFIQKKSLSSSF